MRKASLLILACCIFKPIFSQKEKSEFEKFGRVTLKHLNTKFYSIDSSANAVVLSDIGKSEIEGNNSGGFSRRFVKHTVIHILNKNGYNEANITIPLYVPSGTGAQETLEGIKAVTYNIENGKLVETKLSRSEIINEKTSKNNVLVKFTMPRVKEGSIIEYSYAVLSPYVGMPDPWYFQSTSSPVLWSEMIFSSPQFYNYSLLSRGYFNFDIQETTSSQGRFRIFENGSFDSDSKTELDAIITNQRFVIKNLPELKSESFTRSIKNHLARLEFQLTSQHHPLISRSYKSSWSELATKMLESDQFGKHLSTDNGWLRSELKPIILSEKDPEKIAKKIYEYVRDEFKTTGRNGIYLSENLKTIYQQKKGNSNELNLLLTAMLRYANLEADPVIMSTAYNGYAYEFLPMLTSMNYVITKLNLGDKTVYLDASQSRLGFGKLPSYCYNGFACVVNKAGTPLNFSPDSIEEIRNVNFILRNTENGYLGHLMKNEGYYNSLEIRDDLNRYGEQEYLKELAKKYSSNISISNFEVKGLNNYEEPIQINYKVSFSQNDEDIFYINPLLGENYSKNPFTAIDRYYPVEMPYKSNEIITSSIEIPKGYVLDEMPKQIFIKLDEEGSTFFKYLISESHGIVSVQSQLKIGKTFFMPDEYDLLRQFFTMIIQKQNEQIVFKKTSL